MNTITGEKLDRYLALTEKALSVIVIAVDRSSPLHMYALDFRQMASDYFSDAKHFRDKGDLVSAFAAVNYAHAWLDAGARMKLFDIGDHAGKLFASD